MKKKLRKRVGAAILCVIIIATLMPSIQGGTLEAYAASPSISQFATKAQLQSSFGLGSVSTVGKIKFGASDREWLIAGADGADIIALLSTSSFGTTNYSAASLSIYGDDSNLSLTSKVKGLLSTYETSNFSISEHALMKDTTVTTVDYAGASHDVNGKLYLPDAAGRYSFGETTIYVGSNNDIPIVLDKWPNTGPFWLRSSYGNYINLALVAWPANNCVDCGAVGDNHEVVPAFNLNLSSVIFASAASAATLDGALTTSSAMTLRYNASGTLGSAIYNSSNVTVSNATSGTYLVVQNDSGAWAKAVNGNVTCSAADIDSSLTTLANCQVWLEATNTAERMTTASEAVYDGTAPSLTTGAVSRTSDTAGTVKFSTDEAGSYYYQVVADGAGAPVIGTSTAGAACTTGETTITNPTGLNAGGKDIYIVVKDATGNVSNALKIDIAAYVAPDTTPPSLTAGAVSRTSDTTGTVKFTSDEAGSYYYQVVADGAGVPVIDTSTAGTACTAGETTITNPTGLTVGAKDIYLVVKDAVGNECNALKIDIAAYDGIAPSLTAGAVSRTSNTAGTVKFTSDEAGSYYYQVVADGAGVPIIGTSTAGTACTTGETTITNPTGLTVGAKDIYIVVKDATGNVSNELMIDIAAYVAPTTGGGSPTTNNPTNQNPVTDSTTATISGSDAKGWSEIQKAIGQLITRSEAENTTGKVTINMYEATIVPREMFEEIRGYDITITFILADGIEWVINGKNVTKDFNISDRKGIDLNIDLNVKHIPEDLIANLPSNDNELQLSLAHNGSLGFTATLRINLKEQNHGKTAYLYYYNSDTKQLELQEIRSIDEKGNARFDFVHASDYVIVMDNGEMLQKQMKQITITPSKKVLYLGGNKDKSSTLSMELPETLKTEIGNGSSNYTISYTTSNAQIVVVNSAGKVTAKKAGTAIITATININGMEISCETKITVKKAYIKLIKSAVSMKEGEQHTFQAVGYGIDTPKITWSTTEKAIVVIDKKSGIATAKTTGSDIIIAKYDGIIVKMMVVVKK